MQWLYDERTKWIRARRREWINSEVKFTDLNSCNLNYDSEYPQRYKIAIITKLFDLY